MRSKIEGRNYVLLCDGEREPRKFNKRRTDATIDRLLKACETIVDTMQALYENDYPAYEVFAETMFDYDIRLDHIDDMAERLRSFKEDLLMRDDDIRPFDEVLILSDLGFYQDVMCGNRYERKIKSDDDEEIIEEVIRAVNEKTHRVEHLYRMRTIKWVGTDYGRSSESIVYCNRPVGKRLKNAIQNTFHEPYSAPVSSKGRKSGGK